MCTPVFASMYAFASWTVDPRSTLMVVVPPFTRLTIICVSEVLLAVVRASTLFPPQASGVDDVEWLNEASEAEDDRTPQRDNRKQDVIAKTFWKRFTKEDTKGKPTFPYAKTSSVNIPKRSTATALATSLQEEKTSWKQAFGGEASSGKGTCAAESMRAP